MSFAIQQPRVYSTPFLEERRDYLNRKENDSKTGSKARREELRLIRAELFTRYEPAVRQMIQAGRTS